jgi:hypothetical protein
MKTIMFILCIVILSSCTEIRFGRYCDPADAEKLSAFIFTCVKLANPGIPVDGVDRYTFTNGDDIVDECGEQARELYCIQGFLYKERPSGRETSRIFSCAEAKTSDEMEFCISGRK